MPHHPSSSKRKVGYINVVVLKRREGRNVRRGIFGFL